MARYLAAALLLTIGSLVTSAQAAPPDEGFKSLFDGRTLDGWRTGPDNAWVVEDASISLKREFDGREHNRDYIWTEEKYGNFVLELEFKVPERANSGVFLRTSNLRDPVYSGLEVQVSNSHGRPNLSRGGTAGSIYDCVAPLKNAVKPHGQWNRYRITCRDNIVQVELNGQAVVDMDLDQWTEPHRNPDGTPNKFPVAIKDFARSGHIGFQDHGRPVWYRKIRVKRLD
jgi:hypothetical protein